MPGTTRGDAKPTWRTVVLLLLLVLLVKGNDLCTFLQRRCSSGATCDPDTNQCVCPAGTHGNGLLECVPQGDYLCESCADPKIKTWRGGRASLALPCRHRLAKFFTREKDIRTRASHCLFDVLATNTLVSWGRYFEDSVHITLSVGRLSSSTGRFYASHAGTKQYRLTRDAYFMHNGRYWQRKPWGQSSNVLFEGLRILVNFDHNENFTIYSVPNCGVRIKFRPYVPDQRPQTLLPGISIQAPRSVQFRDRLSSFPASLCGDLDDSTDLNQVAETMGLRGSVQLYIWALLLSGPAQIRGEYKLECHEAMSVFRLCSEQDRPRAIRLCAPIMARAKTLSCLLAKRLETSPMGMFSTCLRYACTNTDFSCRHLKLYLQGCPTTMALRRLECGSG